MKIHTKSILSATLILSFLITNHSYADSKFKDTANHWVETSGVLGWAESKKMVSGYNDGTFRPNNSVTEAEFLTLMLKGYNVNPTAPANAKHWADGSYEVAGNDNLPVHGQTNFNIRNNTITRTVAAELIAASQGVHYTGDEAIKFLLVNNLSSGKTSKTVAGFVGNDKLTRAESLAFIKNALEHGSTTLQPRPYSLSDPSGVDEQYNALVGFVGVSSPSYITSTGVTMPKFTDADEARHWIDRQDEATKLKIAADMGSSDLKYVKQSELSSRVKQVLTLSRKTVVVDGKIRVYLPTDLPPNLAIIVNQLNSGEMKVYKGGASTIPSYIDLIYTSNWTIDFAISLVIDGRIGGPIVESTYGDVPYVASSDIFINGVDFAK